MLFYLGDKVGQTVIPCALVLEGEVSIRRTGIGDDKQPGAADDLRLFAERWQPINLEDQFEKWAKGG